MPFNGALSFTLLACLLISGLWGSLPALGPVAYLALAGAMLMASRLPDHRLSRPPLPAFSPRAAALGLLVCLPVLLYLALTWGQEFPFSGDHDFHLREARASNLFWRVRFVPVVLILTALWVGYRRRLLWVGGVGLLVVVATGFTAHGEMDFSIRYPGAFHFLLYPFSAIAGLLHWASPLNANRLTSALAVPCWVFVLRPVLLGKWPDLKCLGFALLYFFQKDVTYYFASAYLEPWAVIFAAVAAESALGGERWLPLLLIAVGSMFKEQAILLLPFFGLLGWLEIRRETIRKQGEWAVACVLAALPFCLYYTLRRQSGVWRTAGLAPHGDIFDLARAEHFAGRVAEQLGPATPLFALGLAVVVFVSVYPSKRRRVWACLSAAAVFQAAFFYCDKISLAWTGYPRFHMIAGAILVWIIVDLLSLRPKWGVAVVGLGLLLNLLAWGPLGASVLAHADWRRNFFEHTDSPISFPIRSTMTDAQADGSLTGMRRIRLLNADILPLDRNSRMSALPAAYPGLFENYALSIERPRICKCLSEDEAVLAPMVYFPAPNPDAKTVQMRQSECLAELRASCGQLKVQTDGDQPVMALGLLRPSSR